MAGEPLDRFAGGVQYPLETPSKHRLPAKIVWARERGAV